MIKFSYLSGGITEDGISNKYCFSRDAPIWGFCHSSPLIVTLVGTEDKNKHIICLIVKGHDWDWNDARKQTYQLLLRIVKFFLHIDGGNSCKLFRHSATLGNTSSIFFHQTTIKRLVATKRQESNWVSSFSFSAIPESFTTSLTSGGLLEYAIS